MRGTPLLFQQIFFGEICLNFYVLPDKMHLIYMIMCCFICVSVVSDGFDEIMCFFFSSQLPEHVYCTETRPYNQGARLTAYELVHEKLPATLVLDSMVAALLRTRNIAAVVVGADRVCIYLYTHVRVSLLILLHSLHHHFIHFTS